jgi:hypothetical protein
MSSVEWFTPLVFEVETTPCLTQKGPLLTPCSLALEPFRGPPLSHPTRSLFSPLLTLTLASVFPHTRQEKSPHLSMPSQHPHSSPKG